MKMNTIARSFFVSAALLLATSKPSFAAESADMVGLDTFLHVTKNCYAALVDDDERDVFKPPAFMEAMVERKLLGNKTKGGFYKKTREGIQTLDFESLDCF